jgi:hypothetical protein
MAAHMKSSFHSRTLTTTEVNSRQMLDLAQSSTTADSRDLRDYISAGLGSLFCSLGEGGAN